MIELSCLDWIDRQCCVLRLEAIADHRALPSQCGNDCENCCIEKEFETRVPRQEAWVGPSFPCILHALFPFFLSLIGQWILFHRLFGGSSQPQVNHRWQPLKILLSRIMSGIFAFQEDQISFDSCNKKFTQPPASSQANDIIFNWKICQMKTISPGRKGPPQKWKFFESFFFEKSYKS